MLHIGSMFFISTLLYFILLCTVHHRLYVYTCDLSLVLKAARASKELYLSSLVVSPSKEHKQDRINPSFIPTSYSHIWLGIQHGGLHPLCYLLGCYKGEFWVDDGVFQVLGFQPYLIFFIKGFETLVISGGHCYAWDVSPSLEVHTLEYCNDSER